MKLLVTGGAGFIGSHTCVELLAAGYEVVVADNFVNSSPEAIQRVSEIAKAPVTLLEGDLRDRTFLKSVFSNHAIDAVIHFAGLKAVGESVSKPLEYYDNNLNGTIALLQAMAEANVKQIVFSSSATVYGDARTVPVNEGFPLSATNPYGRSKLIIEEMLRDLPVSDPDWKIIMLRYFNPVGAHPSGMIGEDPEGIPNNLMPYICQVATGRLKSLRVFGDDYPTPDGTGVRDYIHVVDLAQAHVAALGALKTTKGAVAINVGTGRGYSVLDVVKAFGKASGREIPYTIAPRRDGDIAVIYAETGLATELMGWQAACDLDAMCRDAWNWQSKNPQGYRR